MKVTININNWKHIPNEEALKFVLKEVADDVVNGLTIGQSSKANFYELNGVEYIATIE